MTEPMTPMLPPKEPQLWSEIEKTRPFVTYAWKAPLCPWCAQWLEQVDLRPFGIPMVAVNGCPSYHGMTSHGQTKWVDFKPPNIERGGDGAWWTEINAEQYAKWFQLQQQS